MQTLQPVLGIFIIFGLCILMSENRRLIPWSLIPLGLIVQFSLAWGLNRLPGVSEALLSLNSGILVVAEVTENAAQFLFGYLAGGPAPFELANPQANFIVVFRVLPLILVVGALSNLLYHWRILPFIIKLMARALVRLFPVSGPLSFGAASSVFLGTIEAPLFVKPYLRGMSRQDLFALFCCTMGTISGTVMVLYASVLQGRLANPMGQLMISSLMHAPMALTLARIIMPVPRMEKGKRASLKDLEAPMESRTAIDALLKGALDGMQMVLQIVAVLLVMFASIYLINRIFGSVPYLRDFAPTLESFLGFFLRPVMWLIGIPWTETAIASELMATKIVLNEFVAYLKLSQLPSGSLSAHSELIMIYACCGFANFGSLGIVVGGISAIMPERQLEVSRLAVKSVLVGNLVTLSSAAVIGLL